MNTLVKSYWKSFGWLLFICYLTLTPSEKLPDMPHLFEYDKLGHFVLFAVFSVLLIKSLVLTTAETFSLLKTKILVFIISTSISGIIEILQANCIRNRNGDMTDLLADVVGTALGIITYTFIAKKFYRLI